MEMCWGVISSRWKIVGLRKLKLVNEDDYLIQNFMPIVHGKGYWPLYVERMVPVEVR